MAGDLAQFETIMRENFVDGIEEVRRDHGDIMGYLRDPSLDKEWHGKITRISVETASNHNYQYAYDGERLRDSGEETFGKTEWTLKHLYGFTTWSNIAKEYTRNSDTSQLALDVYRTTSTMVNGLKTASNALYGGGANELGWISGTTTTNSYSAGTLTFSKVGGHLSGTTPNGKYWYNPNIYFEEGQYVDLCAKATGLPYTDARNMKVTGVTETALDEDDHTITVTGPSGTLTTCTAQDFFVYHGTVDHGETGGNAGWSKAPNGLIGCYAPTDIVTSLSTRYIGNKSKTNSWWAPPTYYDCQHSAATYLFKGLYQMAWAIKKYGFAPDTLLTHPGVARTAFTTEKSKMTFNDTTSVRGGFDDVTYHLGGVTLKFLVSTGTPAGRIFMFDSSTLGYSVLNPFRIIDGPKNQAVEGFDRTAVRFREDAELVMRNAKGGAMMIDIA